MSAEPILIKSNDPVRLPDGRVRLSCAIRVDDAPIEAWFHIPADTRPATDDWVVPIMVVRAMQLDRPVHIVGRVSAKLLEGAAQVQRVFAGFSSQFHPRPITAEEVVTSPPVMTPRTASFFSGGLDSWYSALSNQGSIDDLLFAAGIDMPADHHRRRALIEPIVREAAAALNKPLVHFETNIREIYRPWKQWDACFLGSALGASALALGGRYTRVLIGGAHSLRRQYLQLGTHALVDPLWSSDSMAIVYDGAIPRVEKTRLVATSEAAMRTLRVCGRKDIDEYNCGQCEKCLRTMVALRVVGALERCVTFKTPLDLRLVAAQRHRSWSSRAFMEESLEAALAVDSADSGASKSRDVELIWALRESLSRFDSEEAVGPATPRKPVRSIGFKIRREVARVFRRIGSYNCLRRKRRS